MPPHRVEVEPRVADARGLKRAPRAPSAHAVLGERPPRCRRLRLRVAELCSDRANVDGKKHRHAHTQCGDDRFDKPNWHAVTTAFHCVGGGGDRYSAWLR